MTIKEQAISEYREGTSLNQWYICQCLFLFDKLKNSVETENNKKFQEHGEWFKCLKDDIRYVKGKFIGSGRYIFKKATIDDINNHTFKDEKEGNK